MVDIHCHILPDVDDGAETLSDALEMAYLAVSCGVTDLVATPHIQGSEEGLEALGLHQRQFLSLKDALVRANLPLKLHPGAEVFCTRETAELARQRKLPTIGDTNYVLCEFYFDAPWHYMEEILDAIVQEGYRPIIAHPERYDALRQDRRRIAHWFRSGYVLQVNKGSILGAFGSRVRDTALWMVETGLLHLIASDAHSPIRRTTDLTRLREFLSDRYPPGYVRLLLEENPGRVLRGDDMVRVD